MTKVVRGAGWTLIVSGVVVLLYVVYLLWFTNFETDRSQQELAESWSLTVPDSDADLPDDPDPEPDPVDSDPVEDAPVEDDPVEDAPVEDDPVENDPVELGEAYAAIWFERDGDRVVNDDVLYVVEGVSLDVLRAGPGHYPESDRPGGEGNLAIAGHRTTYGSPFWSMDELAEGDMIHVLDREGREWVYAYREQRIVAPTDVWVVGADPLESGAPTITLTTCHPRGSARQRLIAWGELVGDPIESTAGDVIDALADQ